jgi:hypothetical protein
MKTSLGHYDKEGKPLELFEWAHLLEDMDYRRVGETQVGAWWVSTVWLGLDHNFSLSAEATPLIFETMVFKRPCPKDEQGRDYFCDRYATLADAIAGHEDIVDKLRAGISPENLISPIL